MNPYENSRIPASVPGILETMTIEQVAGFDAQVVVIPIGSTEPHGPHLPYGTDLFLADGVTAEAVRLANAEDARVLRLPPLPIGNNVNFKKFPFACRIRVETLMAVLKDLVQFVTEEGVRKIVLVNCHGGNDSTLHATQRALFDEYQDRAFICLCGAYTFDGGVAAELFSDGSPHAGDYETSLIAALHPGLIARDELRPARASQPVVESLRQRGIQWVRPWHLLMPESYAGNPERATAEKGQQFLDAATAGMARFLIDLSRAPWHPEFPYASKGS